MKRHFIALSCMLALITSSTHAGWFDGEKKERERRMEAEQQLSVQRRQTGEWQLIAGGFAIFVVIAFTVGTILGSRALRHWREGKRNG